MSTPLLVVLPPWGCWDRLGWGQQGAPTQGVLPLWGSLGWDQVSWEHPATSFCHLGRFLGRDGTNWEHPPLCPAPSGGGGTPLPQRQAGPACTSGSPRSRPWRQFGVWKQLGQRGQAQLCCRALDLHEAEGSRPMRKRRSCRAVLPLSPTPHPPPPRKPLLLPQCHQGHRK